MKINTKMYCNAVIVFACLNATHAARADGCDITVSGSAYILVGTSATFTATGGDDGPYTFSSTSSVVSVDPDTGVVSPTGPSSSVGDIPISASDGQGDVSTTPATTTAVSITIDGPDSTDYIWYFDGSTPQNYSVIANATATVSPTLSVSTYYWIYDGGPYKIDEPRTNATVKIESTGRSQYSDDCSLNIHVILEDGTVLTPDDAAFTVDCVGSTTMTTDGQAYESMLTMWYEESGFVCNSEYGSTMTAGIEYNENFTTYHQDYTPSCDWTQPTPGVSNPTALPSPSNLDDIVYPCWDCTSPKPITYDPGTDDMVKVDHWWGYWDLGDSTYALGAPIFDCTWQRYTNTAQHQSFQSWNN